MKVLSKDTEERLLWIYALVAVAFFGVGGQDRRRCKEVQSFGVCNFRPTYFAGEYLLRTDEIRKQDGDQSSGKYRRTDDDLHLIKFSSERWGSTGEGNVLFASKEPH